MTKGEIRKARKLARANNQPLVNELALKENSPNDPSNFSETSKGRKALDRWARNYDDLNGAPEGDWDR